MNEKMISGVFVASLLASGVASAQIEGFTEPARTVEVASPETGVVHKLMIAEGDTVKKGQTIAVLENSIIRASMAVADARMKATADVEAAQARYEQASVRRQRIEELKARGSAREDELLRARSEAAIAVAELKGAQERKGIAELEHARLQAQIDRRTVRSPINGIVVQVLREVGELVSAGQPVVAEIAELGRLHLVSHVPESRARKLRQGKTISVRLADGKKTSGTVASVAPTVDPRSGTVKVKVLLDNGTGAIRSGIRATLALDAMDSDAQASTSGVSGESLSTAQN